MATKEDYCSFARNNLWQHGCSGSGSMARKKKIKRFRAMTVVKELARERIGAPPAGQVVIEKKKKPEKYKATLDKLLGEE